MSRKGGAPTKLNQKAQERICEAVRAGNYLAVSARCAGIHYDTLREWVQRGEREKTGAYHEFSEALKKAESDSEEYAVKMVVSAMPKNWAAAMTYLERRYPDKWRRRDVHEHTGAEGKAIVTKVTHQYFPGPSKGPPGLRG